MAAASATHKRSQPASQAKAFGRELRIASLQPSVLEASTLCECMCLSVPPLTTVHFCFVLITYTVAFLPHTTYVPCLGPTYRGTPVLITYTVAFLLHTTYVPCLGLGSYVSNGLLVR